MNVTCSAPVCPVILNSSCVFYEGESLIYTGINTNDSLQVALQKIDAALGLTTVVNIYNSDGVLTGNRTVSMNSYTLNFEKDVFIYNARVGRGAGAVVTNTVLGNSTLSSNTTGQYNTAVGISALNLNTTGNYNTALGAYSLSNATTAEGNTGLGTSAMTFLTTGYSNTAVGFGALYKVVDGYQNVAIGRSALYELISGNQNIGIGLSAGSSLTTGSKNTIIGWGSGQALSTGSSNTIIGANVSALAPTTSNNIIIADGDGNIQIRDDGANTILPRLAGTGTRLVVTNATGALSTQPIPTGNITGSGSLGQVAFFTGASSIGGNNTLYWDSFNGRLGVGTNTPNRTFTVAGSFAVTGANISITNTITDGDIVIGSTNFLQMGSTRFRGNGTDFEFKDSGTNTTRALIATGTNVSYFNSGGNYHFGATTDPGVRFGVTGDTLLKGSGNNNTTTALTVQNSSSTNLFVVRNDGNVGIGTNAPAVGLDARNGVNLYTSGTTPNGHYLELISNSGTDGYVNFRRGGGPNGLTAYYLSGGLSRFIYNATSGDTSLGTYANGSLLLFSNSAERVRIDNVGNVGIGTTPTALTDIGASTTARASLRLREGVAPTTPNNGDLWSTTTDLLARINGITYSLINSGLSGSGAAGQVTFWSSASGLTGSNNLFWDNTNSRLGIATATPSSNLEITATSAIGFLNKIVRVNKFGGANIFEISNQNKIDIFRESNTDNGYEGIFIHGPFPNTFGANNNNKGIITFINNNGAADIYSGIQAASSNYGNTRAGVYFVGGNSIRFVAGSTVSPNDKNMFFSSVGNLSIGSASDLNFRLAVIGDTLLRGSGNTNTTTALTVQNSDSTNLLNVLNNGNVGIGNNTPTFNLDVTGSSRITQNLFALNIRTGISNTISGAGTFYGILNGDNNTAAVSSGTLSGLISGRFIDASSGGGAFHAHYFGTGVSASVRASAENGTFKVGMNSNLATLSISSAYGAGTAGSVGIGTVGGNYQTNALNVKGVSSHADLAGDIISPLDNNVTTITIRRSDNLANGTLTSRIVIGTLIQANSVFSYVTGYNTGASTLTVSTPLGNGTILPITVFEPIQSWTKQDNTFGANINYYGNFVIGDNAVNNTTALVQMNSTTKGFLPPRMTVAQRTAIATPAEGLIVFQTDGVIGLYVYANAAWRSLTMV